MDNLRSELHQIRNNETTVRSELTLIQNQERSQRTELNQLRAKLNDAEQRYIQTNRQLERLKKDQVTAQQQQTKKDGVRVKKDENNRSCTPDQQQQQMSKEIGEMRARIQSLEKDLQNSHNELKAKQQAYAKLEQRVKTESTSKEVPSGDSEIKVCLRFQL